MKHATTIAALQLVLSGCGGGSGVGSLDGAAGTDALPAAGGCNFPSCLLSQGSACVPSGTCTSEVSGSDITVCYANGLQYVETVSSAGTGATAALTVSNGATACFTGSATLAGATGATVTYTLKNPAGAVIATMTQDMTTGAATVACTGGQPVQLNDACSGGGGCALGTCP